jgi:hypothetical protein
VPSSKHLWFRVRWWSTNVLLALTRGSRSDSEAWAYSVRQYLKGFSGAVVPAARAPEQQLEAILRSRNSGPTHLVTAHPAERSARDQKTIDRRFGVPRFHLCKYLLRADAAFFSTPGIK